MKKLFDGLLKEMEQSHASDLHLISGMQPSIRIDGEILRLDSEPLSGESLNELCQEILSSWQQTLLDEKGGDFQVLCKSSKANVTV